MMRTTTALLLLAAAGCGWNNLPTQETTYLSAPLWDATGAVATVDGLYLPLSKSGKIVLLKESGSQILVDTGPGRVVQLSKAPDDETVIAFVERYTCTEDDPREIRKIDYVHQCPQSKLEVEVELLTLADGQISGSIAVDGHFNAIAYSNDGRYGISYLDFSQVGNLDIGGVVDLTSVLVMNLETGDTTPVSVGFAADRVLFTQDNTRAVVLSKNSVAVVNLTTTPPAREVTFPLTLDADQEVDPVGVALTPDARYALISARGQDDLYVLDLENRSVNLVSLAGAPSAMAVLPDPSGDPELDRTVITYASVAAADVLEHAYFDTERYDLDEPMTEIVQGDSFALLYNQNGRHDIYRLDVRADTLVEYRMENPPISLHLAPTQEFAIALTRAENGYGTGIEGYYDQHPGMEILDLTGDKGRSFPYLLEGVGVGVAFSSDATGLYALVLQEGAEYLYLLDLYTGLDDTLELPAAPVAIGAMPGGGFYIAHDSGLGLVSFYDPTSNELTEISGFAASGLTNGIEFKEEVAP